ncbi:hypothetical protein ACWDKQ_36400, partial [Saccharopolyspora sp. NPDC000995]
MSVVHESPPGALTGRGGSSGADSAAGSGVWHRENADAGLPDSAVLPVDGSQAVPYPQQDRVVAPLAGLPVDAVRMLIPAGVVSGGGLAEFVRGGAADSAGGPVVLVTQGVAGAGVVVSLGQGSALARDLERDVVALTPGQGERGPRWTVFAADGSRPRPVSGPAGLVAAEKRQGMAGLADSSAAVPVSGEKTVAPQETPAAQTASAQAARMFSDADSASVVERRRESMAGQVERSSSGSGDAARSSGAVAGGAAVQPRRGVSRVTEQPGLASWEGEATGEGTRRTSADSAGPAGSAAGLRRRRAWPGGAKANQATSAGNEPA